MNSDGPLNECVKFHTVELPISAIRSLETNLGEVIMLRWKFLNFVIVLMRCEHQTGPPGKKQWKLMKEPQLAEKIYFLL